jgi:hypothetical protein
MSYGILGDHNMKSAPVPPGSPPCDEHFPFDKNDPLMVAIRETARVREIESKRARLAHQLSGILDSDLKFEVDRLLGNGYAENTRKNYKSDFQKFREFCAAADLPSLPSVPEAIAQYIIARGADGANPHVLERAVSAIKYVHTLHDRSGHRLTDHGCNCEDPVVKAALRFVRRHLDGEKVKPTKPPDGKQPDGKQPDGKQPDGKQKESENDSVTV